MAGFLSKLFGSNKKEQATGTPVENIVRETLDGIIEKGGFSLTYGLSTSGEGEDSTLLVEFEGQDQDLLKDREGQLIDSFQLFLKRVIQHRFPEDRTNVVVDCDGYKEESSQQLIELAEKLKGIALEKGKSVYFRALPPKDRKVIHQYLADDARIKSRSIGDGLFKKIKIYPVRGGATPPDMKNE